MTFIFLRKHKHIHNSYDFLGSSRKICNVEFIFANFYALSTHIVFDPRIPLFAKLCTASAFFFFKTYMDSVEGLLTDWLKDY
jgi:hypothetical protein